jgi:hypothetical protein
MVDTLLLLGTSKRAYHQTRSQRMLHRAGSLVLTREKVAEGKGFAHRGAGAEDAVSTTKGNPSPLRYRFANFV